MHDLGAVGSDQCSIALSVNSFRQVVGISGPDCSFGPANAFLWQNSGPVIDLNAFLPPGSQLHLRAGGTINDFGMIAAIAEFPNGDHRIVVLVPCDPLRDGSSCRAAGPVPPARWDSALKGGSSARRRFDLRYGGINFRR